MSTRSSPRLLALLLLAAGAVWVLRERSAVPDPGGPCTPPEGACSSPAAPGTWAPPTLAASTFCRDVGYLCDGLEDSLSIRLGRWRSMDGPAVVHVPLPDLEDRSAARALQRAAARGIRAWNNQPFPILADLRGDRDPHFSVRWTRNLGGDRLGVTRTRWSTPTGLEVIAVELTTHDPRAPARTASPSQVRLTAAHEMGHALGLPHSDSPRDVMYPSNTATSMSAQDYRSIEVLYRTPDGTIVTR